MTKLIIGIVFAALFFVSCQRETAIEQTSQGDLLVKTVEKYGTDSVVVDYSYDVNNRLIKVKQSGVVAGSNKSEEMVITRNGSGIIMKTVEKAAYLLATGVDSVLTVYYYDAIASRYRYSITNVDMDQSGTEVRDSTVYDHDGTGRIIRDVHFQFISSTPTVQQYKQEYVYTTAGNIDSTKNYGYDPVFLYQLSNSISYQYDLKTNPLKQGNEAIFFYRSHLYGINNPTMIKYSFVSPPATSTTNFLYSYNASNLPVSSTNTRTPGSPSSTVFYYQ
jgi:hypothetical protein